jgi:MiaB/RimO family radical SAM methylthiotransferase
VLKVHITYNGCQMRGLDSSRLYNYFKLNNTNICDDPLTADYIIFVSCSVNERSINHSIDLINKFGKNNNSKLIVAGCFPSIIPETLSKFFKGTAIRLHDINDIDNIFPDFRIKYSQTRESSTILNNRADDNKIDLSRGVFVPYKRQSSVKTFFKPANHSEVAFLKISDGCNNACSYCNIKRAVGNLISRPLKDIAEVYHENIEKGCKHFVFIGDDTGGYGMDTGSDLPALLDELQKFDKGKNVKWIFDEANPQWIIKYQEYLIKLASEGKISHIVCPLQSGSQRIIDLMNRPYDVKGTLELLHEIKKTNKKIELHTHVIIGFPSETEEDFISSYSLFENSNLFKHTLISSYHEFEHTDSHKIKPKVDFTERTKRINRLSALLDRKKISYILS